MVSQEYVPLDVSLEISEPKKEKEEEIASDVTKRRARGLVVNFAESLLKIIGSYETTQDKDYNNFLGEREERTRISVDYKLYEQQQACYAINTLIDEKTKLELDVDYSDGERVPPTYQEIEVKRGKYKTLMITGKRFFIWKKMRVIVNIFFRGQYSEATFLFKKKDFKKMQEFQETLRDYMINNNYFKGEKIEYLEYSRIGFLKFPTLSWEDLILNEELKDEIALNLIFPLKNRKLCKKYSVPWRRGVLLAGVPGTGKTQLGRVLCNELKGVTVIWATCKAVHDQSKVKTLFEIARNFAPTLIVMEDIDFFGQDREFITNPIVGELLNQLDGNSPNEGVFILATTNRPYLLDKALADRPSRFDVKLIFDLPKEKERLAMIKLFTQGKTPIVSLDYIANVTDKLTGAHIKEVINYAQLICLKSKRTDIDKKDIEVALRNVRRKLQKNERLMSR